LIDPGEFRACWERWYPDSVPLGGWSIHADDRWLRIHSLPGGKRYPEGANERTIILDVHNTVAGAIIGAAPCVLLGYDHDGRSRLPDEHPLRRWLGDSPPVMRVPPDDEDGAETSVFAAHLEWRPGVLDGPLIEVAFDRLRLMLLNWRTGAVFAPYDGGADLFWASTADRDAALLSPADRFRA
jgi:hypothetical protein